MFWDNFYKLCKSQGTSPNAVCAAIGLSNATATGWKNGTQPKADVLIKLAEYLDCSVDYLLGLQSEVKKENAPTTNQDVLVQRIHALSTEQAKLVLELLDNMRMPETPNEQDSQ